MRVNTKTPMKITKFSTLHYRMLFLENSSILVRKCIVLDLILPKNYLVQSYILFI